MYVLNIPIHEIFNSDIKLSIKRTLFDSTRMMIMTDLVAIGI